MATIKTIDFERSGFGRTLKAVAFVLVLTAAAVTADHLFFFAPSARPAAPAIAQAATVLPVAVEGFALPENLRPTAADAVAQAPTF